MTVPSRNARRVVVNDGNVNSIDMTFPAELAVYVKVYAGDPLYGVLETLNIGSDYTLTGVGPSTVSFTVNIVNPTAWDVETYPRFAVFVDYPVDQPSDVGLGGQFGDRFEAALDRIAFILQSMNDRQKRALVMPETRTVDEDYTLQSLPGTVIGFDDEGNLIPVSPGDFVNLAGYGDIINAFLDGLPDSVDPAGDGLAIGSYYFNGGTLAKVLP